MVLVIVTKIITIITIIKGLGFRGLGFRGNSNINDNDSSICNHKSINNNHRNNTINNINRSTILIVTRESSLILLHGQAPLDVLDWRCQESRSRCASIVQTSQAPLVPP